MHAATARTPVLHYRATPDPLFALLRDRFSSVWKGSGDSLRLALAPHPYHGHRDHSIHRRIASSDLSGAQEQSPIAFVFHIINGLASSKTACSPLCKSHPTACGSFPLWRSFPSLLLLLLLLLLQLMLPLQLPLLLLSALPSQP